MVRYRVKCIRKVAVCACMRVCVLVVFHVRAVHRVRQHAHDALVFARTHGRVL